MGRHMCFFDGHIIDLGKVDEDALARLTAKVFASDYLFELEKKPNKYPFFTATRHIIFQFPASLQDHTVSNYTPYWAEWKELIEPIINEVTGQYNFKLGRTARIMLANICAGGEIGMHIDQNPAADVPHKIHVPIKTDELAEFIEEKSTYYLQRGSAYEVNNKIAHGVKNNSKTERIHLIFDYYDAGTGVGPA